MTISRSDGYPMIYVDDLTEKPFTQARIEDFNMKLTEVYCESCKYRTIISMPAPRCGTCKNPLYVVIRHQSENELAGRNNLPTQGA